MKNYQTMRTRCISNEKLFTIYADLLQRNRKNFQNFKSIFDDNTLFFVFQIANRVYVDEYDGRTFFDFFRDTISRMMIRTKRAVSPNSVALRYTETNGKHTLEYLRNHDFIQVLITTVVESEWRENVERLEDVPSCAHFIFTFEREKIQSIFPNFNDYETLEQNTFMVQSMLSQVMSLERFEHFRAELCNIVENVPGGKRRFVELLYTEISCKLYDLCQRLTTKNTALSAALYTLCYNAASKCFVDFFQSSSNSVDCYTATLILYDKIRFFFANAENSACFANLSSRASRLANEIVEMIKSNSETFKLLLQHFSPTRSMISSFQTRAPNVGRSVYIESITRSDLLSRESLEDIVPSEYNEMRRKLDCTIESLSQLENGDEFFCVQLPDSVDKMRILTTYDALKHDFKLFCDSNIERGPFCINGLGSTVIMSERESRMLSRGCLLWFSCLTSTQCKNALPIYPMLASNYLTSNIDPYILHYSMRALHSLLSSKRGNIEKSFANDNNPEDETLELHRMLIFRLLSTYSSSAEMLEVLLDKPRQTNSNLDIFTHRGKIYGHSLQRAIISIVEIHGKHWIENRVTTELLEYFENNTHFGSEHFQYRESLLSLLRSIDVRFNKLRSVKAVELTVEETLCMYDFCLRPETLDWMCHLVFFGMYSGDDCVLAPGKFRRAKQMRDLCTRDSGTWLPEKYLEFCQKRKPTTDSHYEPLTHCEELFVELVRALESNKYFGDTSKDITLPRIAVESFIGEEWHNTYLPAYMNINKKKKSEEVILENQVLPVYSSQLKQCEKETKTLEENSMPFPNPAPGFFECLFLNPFQDTG